jgi:hypothetical protein
MCAGTGVRAGAAKAGNATRAVAKTAAGTKRNSDMRTLQLIDSKKVLSRNAPNAHWIKKRAERDDRILPEEPDRPSGQRRKEGRRHTGKTEDQDQGYGTEAAPYMTHEEGEAPGSDWDKLAARCGISEPDTRSESLRLIRLRRDRPIATRPGA